MNENKIKLKIQAKQTLKSTTADAREHENIQTINWSFFSLTFYIHKFFDTCSIKIQTGKWNSLHIILTFLHLNELSEKTLSLLKTLNQTVDFKLILQDLEKHYSTVNVDLLFKNCLTGCLLQICIVFVILFAKPRNLQSSHCDKHSRCVCINYMCARMQQNQKFFASKSQCIAYLNKIFG